MKSAPTLRATAVLTAAVGALMIVFGCGRGVTDGGRGSEANDSRPLVFAAVPSMTPATLQQSFQPILEMLRKETGKEIRFLIATDYAAVIEGLRAGQIDIADLGPFSYVLAKQQGVPIVLAAARVHKDGSLGYQSYGITRTGSPIKTLSEFRGKKVCFVDRNSTSGYLYPSAGLLAAGLKPDQDMIPIFVGGHDASVLAVAKGQCDAGFAYDTIVDSRLIEQHQIQPGEIVTVWKSQTIPGSPLVLAENLSPGLREQLTTALQQKANADYLRANGFCHDECGLADGDAKGFVRVDDAFYDSVREVCKITRDKACTGG
jgi:phosphonate transport system substrate-binding protein